MTNRIKAVRIDGRVFNGWEGQYHSDVLSHAIDILAHEGAGRNDLVAAIDRREILVEFGYLDERSSFRIPRYAELMQFEGDE